MRKYAIAQTGELLKKLTGQLARAARETDADAIHDLRVSIRRFNQGLRVFGEFFDRKKAKKLHRRLKKIMDQASQVRDRDIAMELLAQARIAGKPKFRDRLLQERDEAHQALQVKIAKVSRKWNADLPASHKPSRRWQEDASPGENARTRLPALVAGYFQAGRKLVASDPRPAGLHRFRLKTKHLRYTLELFRPVYGPTLEKRLSDLQHLQTLLGEINDCTATQKLQPQLSGFLQRLSARRIAAFVNHWKQFSIPANELRWERGLRLVKKK